jgi:tRNA splicing ligase
MTDCVDHGKKSRQGYVNVWSPRHKKNFGLHRLVLAEKLNVDVMELNGVTLHSCDNKRCVNPEHLSLGSQSSNVKDAYSRGLAAAPSGEAHGASKLSDSQVAYVLRSTKGVRELGRELGVSHSIVSRIRNGKGRVAQRVG